VLITSTTGTGADVSTEPYAHYHVTATDYSGNEGEASSTMSQVGIGGTPKPAFGLAAFPNPFRLSTRVSYSVPAESVVRLVVYDVRGRLVSTLVDGEVKGEGTYELRYQPPWSGVYFMRLQVGSEVVSKKIVVLE